MLFSRATLLALTASLFTPSSVVNAQEQGETIYLTGFLADMLCARLEIAPDATNMITSPAEHTVRCELLRNCLLSGYGLTQNIGSDGKPLYRVAAVFDQAGNDYVVDMFQAMDDSTADLRVHVRGTVLQASTPSSVTPAITSRDGLRSWPAMNDVPTITLDSLQFCNYQGPDAQRLPQDDACTTGLLDGLAAGDDSLATANLCMDGDIGLASQDNDYYLLQPTGCADHATFRDVKRATPASCREAADPCPGGQGGCTMQDTCTGACVDGCGNPLTDACGNPVGQCCLDPCGNPYLDPCGFPFLDPCGNPTLDDGTTLCPADNLAQNQANDCLDSCGNPIQDACGNPVDQCCLDGCGNPILDPCGFPYLDPCGNPTTADGSICTSLGENECLPVQDCPDNGTCETSCTDSCGNPLVLASGVTVTSCCLDGCGNPILDPCGFPYYDPCGNPTLADGGACTNVAENEINMCVDSCGNPLADACGNPIDQCCLDGCGNPVVDACGNPVVDACGNPLSAVNGTICDAAQLGTNSCHGGESCKTDCVDACGNPLADACGNPFESCCLDTCGNPVLNDQGYPPLDPCGNPTMADGSVCTNVADNECLAGGGGTGWRNLMTSTTTRGTRRTLIAETMAQAEILSKYTKKGRRLAGHEAPGNSGNAPGRGGGGSCKNQCADACGNPIARDISGRPATTCCLDACGNPIVDGCGFPFYDACGNPQDGYSRNACNPSNIGESDVNECVDSCGNPLADACGNPIEQCCLDPCGNPLLDPCGFPWTDPCGNPASDGAGTACVAQNIGENKCFGGGCATECTDACGNPLQLASGRTATACCLDPCGNAYVDPCGFPYLDPCGNPTLEDGTPCPAASVAENDVNECLDTCGNPLQDACGNPIDQCCLDICGNPLLDPCGFPFLDPCGNPAMNEAGDVCTNVGANTCSADTGGGGGTGDCSPAFPPAAGSFQCEGLVSVCTLAMSATGSMENAVPDGVLIERRRRRAAARKTSLRRMQGEPSVAPYTPLKKDLRFKIPRTPTTMRVRSDLDPAHDGIIGVAVNGVPIVYEHPGERENTLLFDSCGGHGDLANRYHYHIPPICLLRSLGGTVPRSSDWWMAPNAENQWPSKASARSNKSPLIGWALDGHPIFGPYNPDNGELVVPTAEGTGSGSDECSENLLDECNGMVLANGVYAYFITPTAPFVPPCLMGNVAADAFVDGGLLDSTVSTCPFEGTKPLAGTEICDEKTMIFQDESCPGNADRQDIRACFELATSSFVGEPTCAQMEAAVEEAKSCFVDAGCCADLDETLAEWTKLYPSLEQCSLPETGCLEFGSDNVVQISVTFSVGIDEMVPDTRAMLRRNMATSLEVEPSRVLLDRVSGDNTTSTVTFHIAYATRAEAAAATNSLDTKKISDDLAFGDATVTELKAMHIVPPTIPDLWSSKQKAGLSLSLIAALVIGGVLVYIEEIGGLGGGAKHVDAADDKEQDPPSSDEIKKPQGEPDDV